MIRLKKICLEENQGLPNNTVPCFIVKMHYTLHWSSRLVTTSFVFEMSIIAFNKLVFPDFFENLNFCFPLFEVYNANRTTVIHYCTKGTE